MEDESDLSASELMAIAAEKARRKAGKEKNTSGNPILFLRIHIFYFYRRRGKRKGEKSTKRSWHILGNV
jgi:hypothetical protein